MWCNTFEQEQPEPAEQRLPPFSVLPSVRIVLATLALLAFGTPRAQPGFRAPLSFDVGSSPGAVVVGDFNGDGIPDLAVPNSVAQGTVSILVGNGEGTFRDAKNCATGPYAVSAAVGDLSDDLIPDLVVASAPDIGQVETPPVGLAPPTCRRGRPAGPRDQGDGNQVPRERGATPCLVSEPFGEILDRSR